LYVQGKGGGKNKLVELKLNKGRKEERERGDRKGDRILHVRGREEVVLGAGGEGGRLKNFQRDNQAFFKKKRGKGKRGRIRLQKGKDETMFSGKRESSPYFREKRGRRGGRKQPAPVFAGKRE